MSEKPRWRGLTLGLGFWEANGALAIFPFATLFHELDALEALHYRAFTGCAAFTFERVVLGHKIRDGLRARKLERTRGFGKDEVSINLGIISVGLASAPSLALPSAGSPCSSLV